MSGPSSPGSAGDHPASIGPYRILQVLGEGGMGTVYEAEQTVPMTRRVALKVIKLGMDSKEVLARFEVERQALAVMDHPGIAKVYEAGTTETGRPYVAMELVRGVPLTEYCDTRKLATAERLELFVSLCQAIQHAHQKGVIHRDLKPSNILVSESEGTAVPKVIDFGVAKAIGRRLSDQTLVTQYGTAIGTPAYMSPEQAEMSGLDVDTRTDVYSLGVILYELLVGTVPIDPAAIGLPAFVAQLVLRETNPPTPSARLRSLGQQGEAVARRRHTDPSSLRRQLKGDLDWITMKALDPDRTRRYETVNGLAMDVRRHLRNEPVLARGPGAGYRAAKFIARHRVGVAAVAALFVLLAVSAVTLAISRSRALRAEAAARSEAAKATAINDFLQQMLSSADPRVGGRDVKVADLLDRAVGDIGRSFADQPGVESAVRITVGRSYRGLGIYDDADRQLRAALDLRRRTLPAGDPQVAEALDELGVLFLQRGDYAGADSLLRSALALRRQALGPTHVDVAESMNDLATALTYQGDYDGADSLYRGALAMRRTLLGEDHLDVTETLNNLATLLFARGQYGEAEPLFRGVLDSRRRLLGEHIDVATGMNNLAMTLQRLERNEEAEALYRDNVALSRKLLGDAHPKVAQAINNLGVYLWRVGRLEEAETLIREALALNRRVLGTHPDVAANLQNLALVLRDQREYAQAETLFREAVALDRQFLGTDHPTVASTLNNLGSTLTASGRYSEAERVYRQALAIQVRHFGEDGWQTATTRSLLGECLTKWGRYADAEPLVVRSFEIIRAEFGDSHGRTRAALARVIAVYEALGRREKAAEYRALVPTP